MAHNTEINIDGMLREVVELDHTAQEVDNAVEAIDELREYAEQAFHPNLLDNWYFADPINQRGQTEYGGRVYTIDRWFGNSASATYSVNGDGIVITAPTKEWVFLQNVDLSHIIPGREYTFSILYKAKNTRVRVVVSWAAYQYFYNQSSPATDEYSVATATGVIPDDGSIDFCYAVIQTLDTDGVVDLKAVKLELGSHQTLAHQDEAGNWVLNDPPPNKELELLKCCMSTAEPNDTYANNRVTPAAINAVNKAGDTMTGWLYSAIDGNGYGGLVGDVHGAYLEAYQKDWETRRMLRVTNVQTEPNDGNALLLFNMPANVWHIVLHSGNKPSGSFTGNGSSAARTIETGGIGNCVMISSSNGSAILTDGSSIIIQGGGLTPVNYGAAHIESGVITLATSHESLNASGTTYYYQVL